MLAGSAVAAGQPESSGTETRGGEGGRVIKVTTLERNGEGSLREALEASGPRIVVFEVGGVIDLEMKTLRIDEPFVTIAGQTAPSPGITIVRGGVSVRTHDVSIQHLAVRPGDAGQAKRSGWEPDGIGLQGARDVEVANCSVTWAVDENLSASGERLEGVTSSRVTFRDCLIAEGLDDSSHAKGPHSKGTLIHDRVTGVSIIGCLYASNRDRNPYFKVGSSGVIANCVIFNPGAIAIREGWMPAEWAGRQAPSGARLSIVGNVLLCGRDSGAKIPFVRGTLGFLYLADNVGRRLDGGEAGHMLGKAVVLDAPPLWPVGYEALPSGETLESVLKNVGARPWDRHPIDRRIVEGVRSGEGRIIDSQEQVGGYPQDVASYRVLEVPEIGIGEWLASFAVAAE